MPPAVRTRGTMVAMRVFSAPYVTTLVTMIVTSAALCVAARRYPGRWIVWANRVLALALVVVTAVWLVQTSTQKDWTAGASLPFALCDLATLVAAAALLTRAPLLVELTYFWGLAGTLQAVLTPDLQTGFPSLTFFEYVIAHAGIVCSALFLVVGQQIAPRPRAVPRVFAITICYTAFVGIIDATTGGDYMFLRQEPANWTLLRVMGPWPWYLVTATFVAILLFSLLDAPFWRRRRAASQRAPSAPLPATGSQGPAARLHAKW
jgi:hypothetical integral membrane protein (TIGR02206 family)